MPSVSWSPPASARPMAPRPASPRALGLYVHWPFCAHKCPYCDFNSHVRGQIDEGRFRAALLRDIDWGADLLRGEDRVVRSIFFGGGTPSLMAPDTVAAILGQIAGHWPVDPNVEITLEANPTSAEARRFEGYRAAGVNRVSLGIQALDQAALRFLGRQHGVDEALSALEDARKVMPRVSFDLIYARPDQTEAAWRDELSRALALGTEHLSLYQLTIEPGTAFHGLQRRGALKIPEDGHAVALYERTQDMCLLAGLPAYEISNHAQPGAACRHNRDAWRGEDYLGIGPGAHGRVTLSGTTTALYQTRLPEAWLRQVEERGHGNAERNPLNARARIEELVLCGLRLADGVDSARFLEQTGEALATCLDPETLNRLWHGGFIDWDGHVLKATPEGRLRLNAVIEALLVTPATAS